MKQMTCADAEHTGKRKQTSKLLRRVHHPDVDTAFDQPLDEFILEGHLFAYRDATYRPVDSR